MNNDIKEIYLGELKWTKTHDNMGGVMGNFIFKDNVSYEEYQKLFKNIYFVLCNKDYITNLQEENEKLKAPSNYYQYASKSVKNNCDSLQQRIDKAINYIENNNLYQEKILDYDIDDEPIYWDCDDKATNDLLSILKGSEE